MDPQPWGRRKIWCQESYPRHCIWPLGSTFWANSNFGHFHFWPRSRVRISSFDSSSRPWPRVEQARLNNLVVSSPGENKNKLLVDFFCLWPFGGSRGFWKWSWAAPSSLNVSSYRAIWTHFRQNSMIFMNLNTLQMAGIWDRLTIDSR